VCNILTLPSITMAPPPILAASILQFLQTTVPYLSLLPSPTSSERIVKLSHTDQASCSTSFSYPREQSVSCRVLSRWQMQCLMLLLGMQLFLIKEDENTMISREMTGYNCKLPICSKEPKKCGSLILIWSYNHGSGTTFGVWFWNHIGSM
jgi:hypothetical protein